SVPWRSGMGLVTGRSTRMSSYIDDLVFRQVSASPATAMAAAGRPSTSPDRTARGHPPPEACLTSMRILSPARGASLALATLLAALAPGPTAAAQPTTGSQATRRQQQRHQQPRR